MPHLPSNDLHHYAGSVTPIRVTVRGVAPTNLSNLRWVLESTAEVAAGITTEDDGSGNTVVTVPLTADTAPKPGIKAWQLHGDVDGEGPYVLADGRLTLDRMVSK